MAQHISIRILWKDNGYNGLVCDKLCYNNSYLRLTNIAENRDDEFEAELVHPTFSLSVRPFGWMMLHKAYYFSEMKSKDKT